MLLSLVLIAVVAAAVLLLRPGTAVGAGARSGKSARALALAKEALIARAVADANRPGSLPCPDADGDGSADLFAGNQCPSYVGRLPWRTLGLPAPRDDLGDVPWYALAPGLRDNMAAEPINSDSPAQLTLDGAGNIAAVVFSAGPPLAGQGGRPGNAAADWLDGANADGDFNFQACPRPLGNRTECETAAGVRTAFNDRAIAISRAELMRAVEARVAGEVRNCLRDYAAANGGRHPWAADMSVSAEGLYHDNEGTLAGRLPATLGATRASSAETMSETWPPGCPAAADNGWLDRNWRQHIFVAVAQDFRPADPTLVANPPLCGACLTLTPRPGTPTQSAVVMVAGAALAGQSRVSVGDRSLFANYLEGVNATPAGGTFLDQPPSGAFNDVVVAR
ncbi:MAG: hypothetical protein HY778_14070 [Betaproteobacteria bacterium]|nr:hypothetical protein [Betaproteobacteria bacterium]